MGPEKVATYPEKIAAEIYGLLSFEDRQGLMAGEFPLAVFENAHDRFRADNYPAAPSPEWDRDFMQSLRGRALWKRGLE